MAKAVNGRTTPAPDNHAPQPAPAAVASATPDPREFDPEHRLYDRDFHLFLLGKIAAEDAFDGTEDGGESRFGEFLADMWSGHADSLKGVQSKLIAALRLALADLQGDKHRYCADAGPALLLASAICDVAVLDGWQTAGFTPPRESVEAEDRA